MIGSVRSSRYCTSVVTLLALLIAGCAGPTRNETGFQRDSGGRVLTVAFHGIYDKYIAAVPMSRVAESALNRLDTIDNALAVSHDGKKLRLTDRGEVVDSIPIPDDDDPDAWAQASARLIVAAESRSRALAAAGAEDVYSQLMRGAMQPLDPLSRYADARTARQQRSAREGYGGIGAQISVDSRGVVISWKSVV